MSSNLLTNSRNLLYSKWVEEMHSREFIEFRTSCLVTALAQWDMPYEWAPVMGLVTEGLAGYGDMRNVKRISGKFTDVVRTNFARDLHHWRKVPRPEQLI